MFSGGILFSGGAKLLLGVAGFYTGFFCWGGGGGTFSDSTDIVQNFYREKKEPKNVIN